MFFGGLGVVLGDFTSWALGSLMLRVALASLACWRFSRALRAGELRRTAASHILPPPPSPFAQVSPVFIPIFAP